MYVYKLDTGNHQPEPHYHPTTPPPATITKKSISRTLGSLLWRSKTYREKNHHHTPDKEDTKEMVQESSRKSVPAIDSGRRSVPATSDGTKLVSVIEKGRKTVSGIGEGRKPAWGTEVGMVAGRRSAENRAEMVMVNVGELAVLFQVKVFVTDMPAFMQVHAFRCARKTLDSLEKFTPKQIAFNMKKDFDKVYGPAWHCIVGSSFGSFVTHATGCFLYFSMENLYILVFKTKVLKNVNALQ
ncbi:uncharacterized protein LOC111893350 [Lactuca sativa]|uniref:uncharacterized protein LOC111893350 n=1 Tax=Lactuca sativa TaxID=4236 RepID=UPI000CD9D4C2|nr:uncharacterized protein LOC111893350 [Lactuca sativa]